MDINVGKDYVSPHMLPHYDVNYSPEAWSWYRARERYAKSPLGEDGDTERTKAMAELLTYVTEESPPIRRIPLGRPAKTKTRVWHDIDGRPHEYVRMDLGADVIGRYKRLGLAPRVAVAVVLFYAMIMLLVVTGAVGT